MFIKCYCQIEFKINTRFALSSIDDGMTMTVFNSGNVPKTLDVYTRQCSVMVTSTDVAIMRLPLPIMVKIQLLEYFSSFEIYSLYIDPYDDEWSLPTIRTMED
jgi:hypothetical protein